LKTKGLFYKTTVSVGYTNETDKSSVGRSCETLSNVDTKIWVKLWVLPYHDFIDDRVLSFETQFPGIRLEIVGKIKPILKIGFKNLDNKKKGLLASFLL
jgi:hypothetical protein